MRNISEILRILPVVVFILGRWIFDAYSPSIGDYAEIVLIDNSPKITHWQIFYYIVLDFAWIIYLLNIIREEYRSSYLVFFIILGGHFIADVALNLFKINMTFDEYIQSVSNFEQNILMSGLMTSILLVFLVKIYINNIHNTNSK